MAAELNVQEPIHTIVEAELKKDKSEVSDPFH